MASRRSARLASRGLDSIPLSKSIPSSRTKPTPKRRKVSAPIPSSPPLLSYDSNLPIPTTPDVPNVKPSVGFNPETLLSDALAHLIAVEPRMKPLIDKHPCTLFSPNGLREHIDPWESLVGSIISQQVSGAAAKSIRRRFISLFHPNLPETPDPSTAMHMVDLDQSTRSLPFPTPSQVLTKDLPTLRTAGLSQRKAEYIYGLAGHFTSGALSEEFLASAPYDELVERLTAVRGLGLWSVEMFACFALRRVDVFSVGDLGVQRGMAGFWGRDVGKLRVGKGKWKYMKEEEMREISERFMPFRSVFMWYMWRADSTDLGALE